MTNEERIQRMVAIAEADKPKRGCYSCRYYRNNTSWISDTDRCKNPLVKQSEAYGYDDARLARGVNGLCGPDRLLFAHRGLRAVLPQYRHRDATQILNVIVLGLIGALLLVFGIAFIVSLSAGARP